MFIAGHGNGDSGACAAGQSEAALVRKLCSRLKVLGGKDIVIGDTSINWYKSNAFSTYNFGDVLVCELHMDSSSSSSARGGHVIINSGYSADKYDIALAKFINGFFPGRSKTIVGRSDLKNCNISAKRGVNYRLVECGFISNEGDRTRFINKIDELACGLLDAFGIRSSSDNATQQKPAKPHVPSGVSGTTDELAHCVIAGEFGSGDARKKALGSRYDEVQRRVNEILGGKSSKPSSPSKSIDQVAREAIKGKWGNGEDRKRRLESAGYDYNAVQRRVNQLL